MQDPGAMKINNLKKIQSCNISQMRSNDRDENSEYKETRGKDLRSKSFRINTYGSTIKRIHISVECYHKEMD